MSDEIMNGEDGEQESFADLLDSYSVGMNDDIRVGDKIRGEIISIGKESVFVDTGAKTDGVVDKQELLDENLELPLKEGDVVELYVISNTGNEIRLSKALSGIGGLEMLRDAFHNHIPVEGKVRGLRKGGFDIEIMQKKAFCPISQIDIKFVEKPDEHVGEAYTFLIIEFGENGRNIIVSRRELLKKEQEKEKNKFFSEIAVGTQIEGKVTRLMPYGAFVELIPGVEGMVHLSELSWSRVEKIEEACNVGDAITVKIIGIEKNEDSGQIKLSLSSKQATDDPWLSVGKRFHPDDLVKGTVTRCMKFGAFVEIYPGIEGLIHISEMSYRKRVMKAEDVVKPGDRISIKIKDIDPEKRRISLSLKDVEGDPWIDVADKYKINQTVKGTLEKKEKFGYFISLEPGITGLLPMSEIKKSDTAAAVEKKKPGYTLPVVIQQMKVDEKRITLTVGDAGQEDDWKNYMKDTGKTFGSLGEKLSRALQSKNGRVKQS